MRAFENSKGATTAETLMLAPLYFFMAFGLLQLGQLATALIVVNYAAGSMVRQAIADNGLEGNYDDRLRKLQTAGMHKPHTRVKTDGSKLMGNITVYACSEVNAFPFIGALLGRTLAASFGSGTSYDCENLNLFAFNASGPGSFVVQGTAKGRMNMRPNG